MLSLALAAWLRKRTVIENVLLVSGIICAMAAFGAGTPVHRWLWSFAPGMDLFRFPAYFRWFTWLALLVLAAGTLRAYWSGELRRGALEALLAWAALIAIGITIISLMNMQPDGDGFSFFEWMRAMDLDRRVLHGAAVALPVLITSAVLAWRKKLSFIWLLPLLLLEMGWNTSLAQWNTAVSDIKPSLLHDRLGSLSEGPVIPEMLPTSTYDDSGQRLHYLAHNTQDYLGGFSRNGVNTFWLRNAMDLEVEHTALWSNMAHHPVAYLADSLVPWDSYSAHPIAAESHRRFAVFHPGHWTQASPSAASDHVEITGFEHDAFRMECETQRTALLVLQQSFFPDKYTQFSGTGWDVRTDGTKQILLNVNIAAMAVEVPPGKHTVEFRYSQPIVAWLLAISLVTFFGLLFSIVFTCPGTMAKGGSLVLLASVCWSLFAHAPKQAHLEEDVGQLAASIPNDAAVVMNDDGTLRNPLHGDMNGWSLRADKATHAGDALAVLRNAQALSLIHI